MQTVDNPSFDAPRVVNVATVPHRSPFRYPGGKTWLVPYVRAWLGDIGPVAELVEPFAGGAIVGLTAIFEDFAKRLTLVELDDAVAAVWRVVLGEAGILLANRIRSFEISLERARTLLATQPDDLVEQAFVTIVRNRIQRGGILAAGASLMKEGENGRGVKSRWYPETLSRRILDIGTVRQRIHFMQGDAFEAIRTRAARAGTVFFIDPPYTVAGKRLYSHSDVDHAELFRLTAAVAGDFLMTYDNAEDIRDLARLHNFDTELVPMKSTHHEMKWELLVGRCLDWARKLPGLRSRQLTMSFS